MPLCPIIQAPRTIVYEECTISDDSWAGKHERPNTIYLTLSHSLEALFPSCCAISTFSATPYMPSATIIWKNNRSPYQSGQREIVFPAKLIIDNFRSVDRGHDPKHGI